MTAIRPLNSLLLATVLLLGACQTQETGSEPPYQRQVREILPAGCVAADCPKLHIDTLHYSDQPALNRLIEQRLLALADPDQQWPADSLQALEKTYLGRAEAGWANYLQAKERDRHHRLIVIELSSYLERRGAHGVPGRGFINFDTASGRALSLDEIIEPGQEDAFWDLARQAHRLWLLRNQFDLDEDFVRQWPFRRTPHFALLSDRLLLKYDVYAIAPYSSGHPELSLDYAALRGILREQWRAR